MLRQGRSSLSAGPARVRVATYSAEVREEENKRQGKWRSGKGKRGKEGIWPWEMQAQELAKEEKERFDAFFSLQRGTAANINRMDGFALTIGSGTAVWRRRADVGGRWDVPWPRWKRDVAPEACSGLRVLYNTGLTS